MKFDFLKFAEMVRNLDPYNCDDNHGTATDAAASLITAYKADKETTLEMLSEYGEQSADVVTALNAL